MQPKTGFSEESLVLVGRLAEKLKAQSLFMGTAESCTGGLIAALCTSLPGSSAWFLGGVVAYANAVKRNILAVPQNILDCEGAVSEPVVRHMVTGAMRALGVKAALAVSGVAGPDGGSREKPVGTVWIAAGILPPGIEPLGKDRFETARIVSKRYNFPGDRAAVRLAASCAALEMLEAILAE